MKKIDLLHTTVLIVAILCGYSAIVQIIAFLNSIIYVPEMYYIRSGEGFAAILPILIRLAGYSAACIILVRNRKRIATYILGNDRPEFEEFADAEQPEKLEFRLDRQ